MPSPLEIAFETLLHSVNTPEEPNLGMFMEVVHRTKFTGAYTVHCDRGVPRLIEIGKPIRIDLTRRPSSDPTP